MMPITTAGPRSLELYNVLGNFLPANLCSIVDSYLTHADATKVLILGSDGKPLDSETNRSIIEAIKQALVLPSYDREFIRLIFQNAANNGYTSFLSGVMDDLRGQGKQIVLDKVDFSGIKLKELNFDRTSIMNANFTGALLDGASFIKADLTGSKGLSDISGVIRVNYLTNLTDTGFSFDSANLFSWVGDKPFLIPLDSTYVPFHLPIEDSGIQILINYWDTM
jgi:uncharacterized protein YjbI with pentapeptide repeats